MAIESSFSAHSYIVESNQRTTPSLAELSEYSIRHHLRQRLSAYNWNIPIQPSDEGWPDYEVVQRPSVLIWFGESRLAGVELGSDGARYIISAFIFAKNDAQRTRLADLIEDIFKKTIPIYDYVTGNETTPAPTGEYFLTDDVGWQKIPHVYNAPDAERFRAVVTANVRRVE